MMDLQSIFNSSFAILFFLAIFGLLYSIVGMKNLKRRKKSISELHQSMKIGSEVMFAGGLIGKIINLDEEFAQIQLDKNCQIQVSRYSITQIL
jgi:preprotein translocase subunit YajC